jgi:hypothetical protein
MITLDDYKIIARARTVQRLDLLRVKNNDEGLKTIATIPTLEEVAIGGEEVTDAGIRATAQCKSLDVVTLFGTKKVTDAGVKELASLPKLKWLHLRFMTMDGSALAAFSGSKTLQTVLLDHVDGLTDDGIKHLAKLPNLNELKIGRGFAETKYTTAGLRAIVDARLPVKFEFDNHFLDDDLFESLIAKGWLYGPERATDNKKERKPSSPLEVTFIELTRSKVTDRGFQAVLNCTNVEALWLGHTAIGDGSLKKLTSFKKLEKLAVQKTKVSGVGLEALAGLPLKYIATEECVLTEESFKAFGTMGSLEELQLVDAKMDADWLKHIAKLPRLRWLDLMGTTFDDSAARQIARIQTLEHVNAKHTKLSDRGLQTLLTLPKLKTLSLDWTQVTNEAYQKAKKAHPQVGLFHHSSSD